METYIKTNLQWQATANSKTFKYLYNAKYMRLYKSQVSKSVNLTSEYYLRSSAGQELGVYNFNDGSLTWYIFGAKESQR